MELDNDDSHHIMIPKNINGSKRKHNDRTPRRKDAINGPRKTTKEVHEYSNMGDIGGGKQKEVEVSNTKNHKRFRRKKLEVCNMGPSSKSTHVRGSIENAVENTILPKQCNSRVRVRDHDFHG